MIKGWVLFLESCEFITDSTSKPEFPLDVIVHF